MIVCQRHAIDEKIEGIVEVLILTSDLHDGKPTHLYRRYFKFKDIKKLM